MLVARTRLKQLGLHARKSLSQSFLDDQHVADEIVRAAELDPSHDEVLEVGPGLGVLTERLIHTARRVIAVEIDPKLADWLRTEFGDTNLTVHTGDVLEFEPARWFDRSFVVLANLPYHITSPALRHLLRVGPPFAQRIIAMVQAEVAERLSAQPGALSALAVITQVQAHVRCVRHVPASAFYPRPKVDSAVIRLEPIVDNERLIPRDALAEFTSVVQAGFKQPRKQLANSLSEGMAIEKADAVNLLTTAGIDPVRRPQELAIADWVRLFETTR